MSTVRPLALVLVWLFACGDSDHTPAGGGGASGTGGDGEGGQGGDPETYNPSLAIVGEDGTPATTTLYYEPLAVRVADAEPGAEYLVRASIGTFQSSVAFIASDEGSFDSAQDAPESGDYTGVDVDGLIWSMKDDGPNPSFGDATLVVELLRDDEVLATSSVARLDVDPTVERREVSAEAGFIGVVYVPEGEGPHPIVVGFGGSEGGLWFGDSIARTYASLGYVAIGVAYFGEPTLPNGLTDIPLEYFQSVFDYAATVPEADPSRLAVMGASRGGELALLLGAYYPEEVSAVVALVPSGVVWGSADEVDALAWTWQGVGLAGVPSAGTDPEVTQAPDGTDVYHFRPTFLASLDAATSEELDVATIRVEQTQGPILLIGGEADELWPSCVLSDIAMARLQDAGHSSIYADQDLCFENSGHFTNPINVGYPMTQASLSYDSFYDVYFAMGGTAEGLGRAARGSFTAVRDFLATALAR